jgi:hypothetical protein
LKNTVQKQKPMQYFFQLHMRLVHMNREKTSVSVYIHRQYVRNGLCNNGPSKFLRYSCQADGKNSVDSPRVVIRAVAACEIEIKILLKQRLD